MSEQVFIDMRSDTLTKPSPEMRRCIAEAEVGDDVYGEDPTVNKLENMAAELLGKEAGLLLSSGTQGNLVALLTHCQRGQEIILEREAHIYYYEVGNLAALCGLQTATLSGLPGAKGALLPDDIQAAIRVNDIHFPTTGLLCLENTHNRGGGAVTSLEQTAAMCAVAKENGLPIHLDGARVFNAAVALKTSVSEVVKNIDSIQLCLSKGLGAPIGSVLVGEKSFIERARKWRKMIGGGMRQAGLIAAAGIFALENNIYRLNEDHQNAAQIASVIEKIPGLKLIKPDIPTNIVIFDTQESGRNAEQWLAILKENGIIGGSMGRYLVRLTTHLDLSHQAIDRVIKVFQEIA